MHIELSRKTFALSSIITCSLLSKRASLIAGKVTVDVKESRMRFSFSFFPFSSGLFPKAEKSARAKDRFGEEMVYI